MGPNRVLKTRKSLASKHNIDLILKFVNEKSIMSKWKSKDTMKNYIFNLHGFAEFLKEKKFEDLNLDDTIGYIDYMKKKINKKTNKGLKEITIEVAKARLMTFLKWLNDGERPKFLRDMKVKINPINVTLDQILTEEEVKELIKTAKNFRDKAIIAVLYETGCRIGEFLNMKIRDVKFDKFGAIAHVNGKTGERIIRLVNTVPYLKEWLRYHPDNREDNWFWVAKYDKDVKRLDYMSIWHTLKETALKAEMTKNVRPHIMRHSRITHVATKVSECVLRIMFGWTPGSDMPKIYTHLSGKAVDDAVLNGVYGISNGKEEKGSVIAPKRCSNCGEDNPSDYDFCLNCKWPLGDNSIWTPEKEYWKTITIEKLEKLVDEKLEEIVMKRMSNL
jgi:site-specific recombinase XerD